MSLSIKAILMEDYPDRFALDIPDRIPSLSIRSHSELTSSQEPTKIQSETIGPRSKRYPP